MMVFLARILGALELALAPFVLNPAPSTAAPVQDGLTVVRIDGPLDVGTQALITRAIGGARERGDRLVLELDTPGGEIELMWQLANALLDAASEGVPTAAWVHDRALSAGSLIALACERVYMRSHATLGSALPVQIGPTGLMPSSENAEVREKLSSALRGEFRGVAEKRGRSGLLAEAMVDPEIEVIEVRVDGELRLLSAIELDDLRQRPEGAGLEFQRTVVARGELLNVTGSEAVALGLADGLAESLEELGAKLGIPAPLVTEVRRTRSEDLAALLYSLSPLFLVGGFVLLYLELKAPGFGLPGILSIACFAIVLFGRYLVGLADVPHVLLITAGAALIATEIFVLPGSIWPGATGAAAILAGLIWSFAGSRIGFEYGLDRQIVVEESFRVVSAGFVALLVVWGLSRVLPKTPLFSRMVLLPGPNGAPALAGSPVAAESVSAGVRVGATGRAVTPLRPFGKVVLDQAASLPREARTDGATIDAGMRVAVIEIPADGRLIVTALERSEEGA